MSIYCGTTCVSQPYYDSTKLSKVIYNGTTVWPDKAILLTRNDNQSDWGEFCNAYHGCDVKGIGFYDTSNWRSVVNPYKDENGCIQGSWPDGGSYNMCFGFQATRHDWSITKNVTQAPFRCFMGADCQQNGFTSCMVTIPSNVTIISICDCSDDNDWFRIIYGIENFTGGSGNILPKYGTYCMHASGYVGNCCGTGYSGTVPFTNQAWLRGIFPASWDGCFYCSNLSDSYRAAGPIVVSTDTYEGLPTAIYRYCVVCRCEDDGDGGWDYIPDHLERLDNYTVNPFVLFHPTYSYPTYQVMENYFSCVTCCTDIQLRLENECWASCWYGVAMFGRSGGEGGTTCYCDIYRGRWWTMYPK